MGLSLGRIAIKMTWKLYIDDLRTPKTDGWVIARSSQEAILLIREKGFPNYISFDFDLGGEDTAFLVVKSFIDPILDGVLKFPENFEYNVHSANPIGAEKIRGMMDALIEESKLIK
jgi:hypothetical protein